MTAIILGWDPDRRDHWNYAAVIEQVAATGLCFVPWRVGQHRNMPAGADAWLLLQGRHGPALIGHGVVVSEQPEPGPRDAVADETATGVQVAFDALLPLGDQIASDVLAQATPGVPWGSVDVSGFAVAPAEEANIRALWGTFGPAPGPDPTQPVPGTYPADAVTRAEVNRYERDPEARRACIAQHGINCAACGFSFEATYGDIGKDFIHVHHVVPVSQLGNDYQLDPLTDLVPLCANCHAMVHQGVGIPRSIVELRQIIADSGFLRGTTVSPEELEAQRVAREILGPGK
jgi:5-methylcytosine-specific restriction protein A